MSEIAADRNLLFGILALQMDFVSRDALIAAMNAWVLDKQQPLGAILVEQGALRSERRALLEPLVDEHVRQHGEDPAQSLAAVDTVALFREALRSIADGDLQFSLGHLGTTSSDPDSTATYVGSPTSSGGRFRILRFEAAGGLGEVYVARDEELHREVALKRIKDEYAHVQDLRSRFVVEAEITGGLEHPGIVPVYGLGHYDDGRPYYAMRFIKGESLKDAIKRFHQPEVASHDPTARSLSLRQLMRRFLDVCNAIQYAHDRGVLHRDLKPGNVMLGPYGETLVVDWGLAKVVGRPDRTLPEETLQPPSGSDLAATVAGVAIGTLAYMSPEQARGDLDRLGPASDVYSLGATLYHLLTGQAPFQGSDRTALQAQVIAGEFPPPSQLHSGVPAGMDAICRKAMAREPQDRYARPKALADDIEHWLADEPVTALPESWSQRAARWTRRHRDWVRAGAVALALVPVTLVSVAATLAVNHARGLAEQRRKEADVQRGLADVQSKEADKQRHRAEWQLARSDLGRGLDYCEPGDAARGLLWLARGLKDAPADASDVRHCIRMNLEPWSRDCHAPLICLEHGSAVSAVAFSPDGKTIATACWDKTARLWDISDGKPIGEPLPHQDRVSAVAFSPDGKTIATGSYDNTARLWDAATSKPIGQPLTHEDAVLAVAFSPDGKTIVTGGGDFTARLWDTATGTPVGLPMTHQSAVTAVVFSPAGKAIATGSQDTTARLWDATTGEPIGSLMTHQDTVSAVAFSPDGKTVATGSFDRTARLWDAATGKPIGSPTTHLEPVTAVAFSPDGKAIATGSYDTTARLWDPATGKPIGLPMMHQGYVFAVAFSPDGKAIATGSYDTTARLWDAATGKPTGSPMTHREPVAAVAFSPDGKTIVTGSQDRTARLWDATTGKPIGLPMTHQGYVSAVAFSPDGKTIATGSQDRTAQSWDGANGKPIGSPMTHQGYVSAVAFSPDRKTIATGSGDRTARIWDAATGKPIGSPMTHQDGVFAVAFSPDGKTIATGSGDRTARIWDAATCDPLSSPMTHQDVLRAVAFSPDGKAIATGSGDRTARIWDTATGKPIGSPMTHQSIVAAVAFSPDGKAIATGSSDNTARLWDVATGKPIGSPMTHHGSVTAVAFSPDGKAIATGSLDKTVRLWGLPSPVEDDADRITVWIRCLTNMELDSSDAINVLDGYAWNQNRQELARRGGPPSQANHGPEPDVAWHRREARESEIAGQWFAARWHLDRLIALRPADSSLYIQRAEIHIRSGHPTEAADEFARLIEFQPEPIWNWVKATNAQLLAGRVDRYRKLSRAMLRRFEKSSLGTDTEYTAKACLTVPDRPDLVARAAVLAERNLQLGPNDARMLYCAALADYRVGRYQSTLDRLYRGRDVQKTTPTGDWPGYSVMSYAVEAMALAGLNLGAEARAALKQAESTLATELAAVRGTEGYMDFWPDWLHCEVIVREAQDAVAYVGFPADPFAP